MRSLIGLLKRGKGFIGIFVLISVVGFGLFRDAKYAMAEKDPQPITLDAQIQNLTAQRENLVTIHKQLGEKQKQVEVEFWKVTGALGELIRMKGESDSKDKKK